MTPRTAASWSILRNEFLAEAQQSFDQLVRSMLIEFPTLTREQADAIVAQDEFFAGRIEKSTF